MTTRVPTFGTVDDDLTFRDGFLIRSTPTRRPVVVDQAARPVRHCPDCAAALEYHDDATAMVERAGARPQRQNFYACNVCGHCESVSNGDRR